MASGSETRQKTHRLTVRFAPAEWQAFQAAVHAAGYASVGAFVRSFVGDTPARASLGRPPLERAELGRLLGEAGKIGSNVNQLARTANISGDLPAAEILAELQLDVRTLRDALMRALGHGE